MVFSHKTRFDSNPASEIHLLEQVLELGHDSISIDTLAKLEYSNNQYPLYCIRIGNPSPDTPKLALIGGIHGIERIGAQVVIAYLETLLSRLKWDELLHYELESIELIFLPVVNPIGMLKGWRANGQGVDLMRNAPVDADERVSFLVGGHRLGTWLPWYRGHRKHEPQVETQALINLVKTRLLPSPFSMVLDCHSGFGMENRLWFPYAGSSRPPENLAEIYALKQLFSSSFPHQNYIIEPQSRHYLTHGDIWDYLYRESLRSPNQFIPLTLELGSWRWVKKNPLQLASLFGLFNPVSSHRLRRALRSHIVLLEFLLRASNSYASWQPSGKHRSRLHREALEFWYA